MQAAEVVVGEVQRNGHLEVQQFLAERIREARESADRHTHREALALYKASRDVVRVRIAATDLGYNLRDASDTTVNAYRCAIRSDPEWP